MVDHSGPSNVGDAGRRVARRRRELGLSVEDLAARAGMSPAYVRYLESQPAQLTHPSAMRLAVALETTVDVLLGGGVELPAGQGGANPRAELEALSPEECRQFLAPGGVGRLVFLEARGPVALPVNFRMLGDDVVLRTAALSSVRSATQAGRVGFEVDHIDDAMREGWSVLVTGYAHEVREAEQLQQLEQLGVEPWSGDDRPFYVRIEPVEVSGRRIRSG